MVHLEKNLLSVFFNISQTMQVHMPFSYGRFGVTLIGLLKYVSE